jgi:putative Mn2+ efflux pump MntP
MDSFAASLAAGAAGFGHERRAVLRLSFHFGLFQFLMPVLGWSLGIWIEPLIAPYDHWVAFVLLLIVAIRMIRDDDLRSDTDKRDPTRGLMLIMLSTATSIDALAIGLGLAMLGIRIWTPSVAIGVITSLVSITGMTMGSKFERKVGRRMQYIGAAILIFIGARIVITHTLITTSTY